MSDYPNPGRSDPEAYKAWHREYNRRYGILNSEIRKAAAKQLRKRRRETLGLGPYTRKKRPDRIQPDMSDYPCPSRKYDPEGYRAWKKEYGKRFYLLNREALRSYFDARRNTPEVKAQEKAYRDANKAQIKAYRDTPEYKARAKARASTTEGRASSRLRQRKYAKTPKSKARYKRYRNSDHGRAARQAYEKSAEGKAKKKRKDARRRKAESMIPLTQQERQQLIILEQKRLHLTETTGIVHHLDHILPLAKGGIHHPINLRIITAEENISKGDKVTPEAMALIPQIQAIVNERKGWLNTEQDSTLADLFTTDEDET
jgi:hypothetical protein